MLGFDSAAAVGAPTPCRPGVMTAAAALAVCALGVPAAPATKPHFLTVLADDLGYWDTTVHNPDSPTPNIRTLFEEGIVLERHYVFRYCSPTRRAFLSGRFPNHITNEQAGTCSNYLPIEVDILSQKLAKANYSSHFIGKGHLGYQTVDHLPVNRGFATHVGYLGGAESYQYGNGDADPLKGTHDMWHNEGPGIDVVPEIYYSANFYTERAVGTIEKHPGPEFPLWIHLTYQNVHAPYVAPPDWECHQYPEMWNFVFANMVHMLDSGIGNVTAAWKQAGLWDNTLMVFSADNGGIGPANNHPLRGHKHDAWEGGTRATAFISGGLIPPTLRGSVNNVSIVHIVDWYATFTTLAGIDPTNNAVMFGKPRPIDGVDVWPMLTKVNTTQPREFTPTSDYGLVWGKWKVVTLAGQSNYYTTNSSHINPPQWTLPCLNGGQAHKGGTDNPVSGCVVCNETLPCLFDLSIDSEETTNVAAQNPAITKQLAAMLQGFQPYGDLSSINATALAKYTKVPAGQWKGYAGPCYWHAPPSPPSPPSPPPPRPPPPGPPVPIVPCTNCSFEENVHYPDRNSDIAHRSLDNATLCCGFCGQTPGCVKFAFDTTEKKCTLKNALSSPVSSNGFISGSCHKSQKPSGDVSVTQGCMADEQCLNRSDGAFRCLKAVPGDPNAHPCTLDYGYNTTGMCTCQTEACTSLSPPAPKSGATQAMIIGDSVSNG
mmetsp:Transcript_33133/g.100191  ORF Transcript_33133/g.100191 Transcript_33133/m.100191 type:complete len:713 (-) Transcript_33133:78-2216(-)